MRRNSTRRTTVLALLLVLIFLAPRSAGAQEGIKVHGDWTLTVRNQDGSVAGRHEFRNALAAQADRSLAQLLAGDITPGRWQVSLYGNPSTFCNADGAPCIITEVAGPYLSNSTNLTAAAATSGPDAGKLVLTGSVKIPNPGNIVLVNTVVARCSQSVAPVSCADGITSTFTVKDLTSSPVPVAANQTVDVVVVISFS
jgi:hypothetical protein